MADALWNVGGCEAPPIPNNSTPQHAAIASLLIKDIQPFPEAELAARPIVTAAAFGIIDTLRRVSLVVLTCVVGVTWAGLSPAVHIASTPAAASTGWTTYHKDGTRNGFDPNTPAFPSGGNPTSSWTTNLDGNVYASPLALNGVVYAATENNSIYALDEITGRAIWQWHQFASQPDPASAVGCGNIDPVGITGTPVIDPSAGIIYAVGLVAASGGGTKFQIFGVHLIDGSPVTGFPLDIGQPNPIYQEQRAALALSPSGTMVYVAFGGWAGDCQPYHPMVVGVPVGANLGQGQLLYQPQTSTQGEAGIWGASGPAIDASGNVYVTTGNGAEGNCSNPYDHSEAVIKLSPTLGELGFWAANNWCSLNSSDNDVGSLGPLLLANGQIFQTGKPGDGYLINSAAMTGINTQLYQAHIDNCPTSDAVFGGDAYMTPYVYVPCDGTGLIALKVDNVNNNFSLAWQSSSAFTPTAPIIAGGVVWTMGPSTLYGFDQTSGAVRFSIPIGGHTRFATEAEDNGWVIVNETSSISAFSWTWSGLGGILASDPGAAAPSATRADVFARGSDRALWHRTWNGTSWQAWESLGGLLGSAPGTVADSATRIDVFIRGVDGALWHRMWNGTSWQAWESLGGIITSGPDAAAPGTTRIDVFARGTDNALWHRWWDGTTWQPWESLGGIITSDPGAVAWAAGRLDVFARGTDNALWHRAWDGTNWLPWESLGGILTSAPGVGSCASGKLDVFVRGTDSGYWRRSFNGSWGAWSALGGPFVSGPATACLPGTTTLDVFGAGADYSLLEQTLAG